MPALLEMAHPDVYTKIAFRILELPVEASNRDVSKRQQVLEMALRNGMLLPAGPARLLPSLVGTTLEQVKNAVQFLRDPISRLHHELFWFWPAPGLSTRDDEALLALQNGHGTRAKATWSHRLKGAGAPTAAHNLLILRHQALLETALICDGVSGRAQEDDWVFIYAEWNQLLEDSRFWQAVDERVRVRNDPRFGRAFTQELRDNLRSVIPLIGYQVACRAVADGASAEAAAHISVIEAVGFSEETLRTARKQSTREVRERLHRLCDRASDALDRDQAAAWTIGSELWSSAQPLLIELQFIVPAHDPGSVSVAEPVASIVVDAFHRAPVRDIDWGAWAELLRVIAPYVSGKYLQTCVTEAIDIAASHQCLDPIIASAHRIFDSDRTNRDKCDDVMNVVMPKLHAAQGSLAKESRMWAEAADIVSALLLRLAIALANDDEDFRMAVSALSLARRIVVDAELLQRIREAEETAQGNLAASEFSACLRKIMDSNFSNQAKLKQIQEQVLTRLAALAAEMGHYAEAYNVACDMVCMALNALGARLNNDDHDYHTALNALSLAQQYVKSQELRATLATSHAVLLKNREAAPPPATGCFIATAAYGSAIAGEVHVLRSYRDEVLLATRPGRAFVRLYYLLSPPLARMIAVTPPARRLIRTLLRPLIAACRRTLSRRGGI